MASCIGAMSAYFFLKYFLDSIICVLEMHGVKQLGDTSPSYLIEPMACAVYLLK